MEEKEQESEGANKETTNEPDRKRTRSHSSETDHRDTKTLRADPDPPKVEVKKVIKLRPSRTWSQLLKEICRTRTTGCRYGNRNRRSK